MSIEVSYTEARARLASLWDEAVSSREPIIIRRRGKEAMAMIPAEELAGIMETAHLLRSPRSAERLLTALTRVREREGKPSTIAALRAELGLGKG